MMRAREGEEGGGERSSEANVSVEFGLSDNLSQLQSLPIKRCRLYENMCLRSSVIIHRADPQSYILETGQKKP